MKDINLEKSSSLGWIDEDTYCMSFDAEPETDSDGNSIHCWYDIEYHADEKKIIYAKTMEDAHGNCESVSVEDVLDKNTKNAIKDVLREHIGIKLVLL